jgi:hypothetical protein
LIKFDSGLTTSGSNPLSLKYGLIVVICFQVGWCPQFQEPRH